MGLCVLEKRFELFKRTTSSFMCWVLEKIKDTGLNKADKNKLLLNIYFSLSCFLCAFLAL